MKRINPGLLLAAGLIGALTGVSAHPASAQTQRMAVPSYFYPGAAWTQMEAAAPTVGLAIINPNSGPGTSSNADYVKQVREAKAHGLKVIGYVHTSYGKRPFAEVKAEIKSTPPGTTSTASFSTKSRAARTCCRTTKSATTPSTP